MALSYELSFPSKLNDSSTLQNIVTRTLRKHQIQIPQKQIKTKKKNILHQYRPKVLFSTKDKLPLTSHVRVNIFTTAYYAYP